MKIKFSSFFFLYIFRKLGFRKYLPPCAGYAYYIKPDALQIDAYGKANPLDENTQISPYSHSNHFDKVHSYDVSAQGYENKNVMNVLMCTGDVAMVAINKANESIEGYATAGFTPDAKIMAICGLKADTDVIAFWLFR